MLTIDKIKFAKHILLVFLVALLSCAPLRTPRYVPQGEFATPDEIMSSNEISKNRRSNPGGPFRLRAPVLNLRINRGFINGARDEHHGLDVAGKKNDPIFSAHEGIVIYAGQGFRGYGKMILIEYDHEWASLYAHLNKFEVRTGDQVKSGQLIGRMGKTGRASGVHLHFELMKNRIPVDPTPYFNGNTVALF